MSRPRATVIALRDDKVLLVMDKGAKKYSLPGGRVERGEPSIAAAARELYEETDLSCSKIEWLFHHESKSNSHQVFLATATGDIRLKDGELNRYTWWDGNREISVYSSVKDILRKARKSGNIEFSFPCRNLEDKVGSSTIENASS